MPGPVCWRLEQLLHAHSILKLSQVVSQAHLPELLEHARPVERRNAQRNGRSTAIEYHWSVHCSPDSQRRFAQAAVFLSHTDHLLLYFEWPYLTVEDIAAIL